VGRCSLGSFYQNVVWIQFSTIVSQTVDFYSVSKDDVRLPCLSAVRDEKQKHSALLHIASQKR